MSIIYFTSYLKQKLNKIYIIKYYNIWINKNINKYKSKDIQIYKILIHSSIKD
jgi:hypothetical protein